MFLFISKRCFWKKWQRDELVLFSVSITTIFASSMKAAVSGRRGGIRTDLPPTGVRTWVFRTGTGRWMILMMTCPPFISDDGNTVCSACCAVICGTLFQCIQTAVMCFCFLSDSLISDSYKNMRHMKMLLSLADHISYISNSFIAAL